MPWIHFCTPNTCILAFFSVSWTNTSFQRPVTQKVRCFTSKWRETTSDIWLRWLLVTLALVSFSLVLLVIVAFLSDIVQRFLMPFCLLDWSGFNYIKLFYIPMLFFAICNQKLTHLRIKWCISLLEQKRHGSFCTILKVN